jgi:hypothetical protein
VEAIQALVVSEETAAGLGPINQDRKERGFTPLEVQFSTPLSFDQLRQLQACSTALLASPHCSYWRSAQRICGGVLIACCEVLKPYNQ